MQIVFKLEELSKFKNVAIYGAGHAGEILYYTLKHFLPNTKTKLIIDDFKSGNIDSIPIISSKELKKITNEIDAILVSALIKDEIENTLLEYDHIPSFYVRINYFHNVQEVENVIVKKNSLKSHKFNNKYLEHEKASQFKAVSSLLQTDKDRELYSLILESWLSKSNHMENFFCNSYGAIGRHYFEFIIPEAIHTVIEGGVADGTNTIEMLQIFPLDCTIYGFDPIFDNYTQTKHKKYISDSSRAEVSKKGLWNKDTTLSFVTDSTLALSRVVEDNEDFNENSIHVITIDNFVKMQNIKKVDFIKFDIEGSEIEALYGGLETIIRDRPQMALSIYHKFEHLYEIPLLLFENLKNYTYRIGHYHYEIGESVLYAIPNELYIEKT